MNTVRKGLRILSLLLLLGATIFWLAKGANRGWTENRIPHKVVDKVTGIEGVKYEKGFVPGVDFLGAAVLGAAILAGASFLFRNKNAGK